MSITDDSYLTDMPVLCSALDQADAILIGAGAGLSAAAGHLYMDLATFRDWFPGYHENYGLRYVYEATFFDFPTVEEYYAFWARLILKIRFRCPAGKPCQSVTESSTGWCGGPGVGGLHTLLTPVCFATILCTRSAAESGRPLSSTTFTEPQTSRVGD